MWNCSVKSTKVESAHYMMLSWTFISSMCSILGPSPDSDMKKCREMFSNTSTVGSPNRSYDYTDKNYIKSPPPRCSIEPVRGSWAHALPSAADQTVMLSQTHGFFWASPPFIVYGKPDPWWRHEGLFLFRQPHCHVQDKQMGYVSSIFPHPCICPGQSLRTSGRGAIHILYRE